MKLSTGYSPNKFKKAESIGQENASKSGQQKQNGTSAAEPIHKRRIWPLILILISCCYILAGGVILSVVWDNLADYETTLPQNYADSAALAISNGDYSLLTDTSLFELNEYEDENARIEYLNTRMKSLVPIKAQFRGERDGSPSFTLVSEGISGEGLAELILAHSGEFSPYGRPVYKDKRIIPIEDKRSDNDIYFARPDTVIYAPEGLSLLINGIPLKGEPASKREIYEYIDLKGQPSAPKISEYRISGLLLPPEISVEDDAYSITANEDKTEVFAELNVNETDKAEISKLAKEASLLHARIITRDATFSMLKPYLLPGGPAYNSLVGFDNSYYISHDSYSHKNMEVSGFKAYDKNRISCVVKFDYFVQKGKKEFHYPTQYTVFFTRADENQKFLISQVRPH